MKQEINFHAIYKSESFLTPDILRATIKKEIKKSY